MIFGDHLFDLKFFEEYLREKKGLAESSIYCYVKGADKFLREEPNLNNLDDYNNFLIRLTIKKRSPHYCSILKAYIEFKISDPKLKEQLLKGLVKPRERTDLKRERRHLEEEQIIEIINNLKKKKHRIVALIQSLTGVRASDILRLKRGGIKTELYKGKEVLRLNIIGKGGKRNVIFIHDNIAQQVILEYITTTYNFGDYYFLELSEATNRTGEHNNEFLINKMNYQWYWADLKEALSMANVSRADFATHDFRRCFARRVWIKYKDLFILQNILNHSDPKTTMRYLKQSGLANVDYHYEMQM